MKIKFFQQEFHLREVFPLLQVKFPVPREIKLLPTKKILTESNQLN